MIKRFARWLYLRGQMADKEAYDKTMDPSIRPQTNMERLFGECQPAIIAFRIENGYVMRSLDVGIRERLTNGEASGYVYCKDHAAIAEHIVSEAARTKLGVGVGAMHTGIAQQSLNYGGVTAAPRR